MSFYPSFGNMHSKPETGLKLSLGSEFDDCRSITRLYPDLDKFLEELKVYEMQDEEPEPEPEPELELKTENDLQAKQEHDIEIEIEAKAEQEAECQIKENNEVKAESKPQTKVEAVAGGATMEAEIEAKVEAKKIEEKTEVNVKTDTEAKNEKMNEKVDSKLVNGSQCDGDVVDSKAPALLIEIENEIKPIAKDDAAAKNEAIATSDVQADAEDKASDKANAEAIELILKALVTKVASESKLNLSEEAAAFIELHSEVKAVADVVPETVADTVADTIADTVANPLPEAVDDAIPEAVVDAVPEAVVNTVAKAVPEAVVNTVAKAVPEAVVNTVAKAVPEAVVNTVANAVPEAVADVVPDAIADVVHAKAPVLPIESEMEAKPKLDLNASIHETTPAVRMQAASKDKLNANVDVPVKSETTVKQTAIVTNTSVPSKSETKSDILGAVEKTPTPKVAVLNEVKIATNAPAPAKKEIKPVIELVATKTPDSQSETANKENKEKKDAKIASSAKNKLKFVTGSAVALARSLVSQEAKANASSKKEAKPVTDAVTDTKPSIPKTKSEDQMKVDAKDAKDAKASAVKKSGTKSANIENVSKAPSLKVGTGNANTTGLVKNKQVKTVGDVFGEKVPEVKVDLKKITKSKNGTSYTVKVPLSLIGNVSENKSEITADVKTKEETKKEKKLESKQEAKKNEKTTDAGEENQDDDDQDAKDENKSGKKHTFSIKTVMNLGDSKIICPISNALKTIRKSIRMHAAREVIVRRTKDEQYGFRFRCLNVGVFITLAAKDSPAQRAGFHFGDQVLSINGQEVVGMDAGKVNKLFANIYDEDVKFVIRPSPYCQNVNLEKDEKGMTGFGIKNGFVDFVLNRSSAYRSGLMANHRILEVNGLNVIGMGDRELTALIRNSSPLHLSTVSFKVFRIFMNDIKDLAEYRRMYDPTSQ